MSSEITTKSLQTLMKLLTEYKNTQNMTPAEFMDELLIDKGRKIPEKIVEMFLRLKRHVKIFECLLENFLSVYKLKQEDKSLLFVLLYVLVFELGEENYLDVKIICQKLKMTMFANLMKYTNREEFLILLTEITSSVFDNDYTLDQVIRPLIVKMPLLEKLQSEVLEYFYEKTKIVPKALTKPVSPRITKIPRKIFTVVAPVEPVCPTFANKVPSTTYVEDVSVKKKIQEAREINKANALKLLALARETAFSCSKPKENPKVPKMDSPKRIIKAKKVPTFKEVPIKKNAAMLMREAALFVKNHEKECKRIEDITNGAFDTSVYEAMEEEEQKRIQQENIQNIEKRHLQGLLTYEEALLAKQNLIESNKKKMLEFKEERDKLYQELEKWREKEQKKIKILVEKSQNIQKMAREAEKKSFEEKYRSARDLEKETKRLLEKAMAEKEAELARKIELIKELKVLESFKELNQKEFDPTETRNLGLLCEMSIAELQERLGLLKIEIQEELEKKRQMINEAKKQRQEFLQNTEEFIQQNRSYKEKEKKKSLPVKLEETPEILLLRNKLEELRRLRTNTVAEF